MKRTSCIILLSCIVSLVAMGFLKVPGSDRFDRWQGGGLYAGGMAYWPGHDSLIVSSPVSGRGDLWEIDRNGQWAQPLMETAESEIDPHASRSDMLYFARFVGGRYCIFSRNMATQAEILEVELYEHAIQPVPLPSGDAFLFVRCANFILGNDAEIWEKSLKSGELRRLAIGGSVSCFGDSQKILFCKRVGDDIGVYEMSLKNQSSEFICLGSDAVLSDDEKTVFMVRRRTPSYDWDVWSRELASGVERAYPFGKGTVQSTCQVRGGRVAAVFWDVADNAGIPAILDPSTGEWKVLPRLLKLTEFGKE